MSKVQKYQRYPAQFKRMALLKTTEEGVSDVKVCEELVVNCIGQKKTRSGH